MGYVLDHAQHKSAAATTHTKEDMTYGDTACKYAGTDVAISADYFSILLIIASQD